MAKAPSFPFYVKDWLWGRYDPLPDDVISEIAALYDKKVRLMG